MHSLGALLFRQDFPKKSDLQKCWSTTYTWKHQYVDIFLVKSVHSRTEYVFAFVVLY